MKCHKRQQSPFLPFLMWQQTDVSEGMESRFKLQRALLYRPIRETNYTKNAESNFPSFVVYPVFMVEYSG